MTSSDNKVPQAIRDRVLLVNGKFSLPDANAKATEAIRTIFSEAAEKFAALLEQTEVKYDTGRAIHALDTLQAAKDTACVSVILPFASTDPRGLARPSDANAM
jgi:hypothetical protein